MTSPIQYLFEEAPSNRVDVLAEVSRERDRQDVKWGPQQHSNGTSTEYAWIADAYRAACQQANPVTWHDIFLEEVFEAMAEVDDDKIEHELIQAIAVAVHWVEDIRRRRNAGEGSD